MKRLTLTLCLLAALGSLMAGPVDQQKAQRPAPSTNRRHKDWVPNS